ncbi:hypothetical protein [Halorussus halobius]|uniref:hypothetical protein n=1 Tax=Halorussus halobius TaxID=1710537 RepID=UPI0010930BDD|nr:hypothetical protein [Halorussus halobius]
MDTEVHYRETQTFDQPWLWGLLGLRVFVVLARAARGERSTRETARSLVPVLAAAALVRTATLYTEVRTDGIHVKFAPFHRSFRRIPFSELADVQSMGYSPLRYGGWGIRWRPSEMAYTASGTTGVRFERSDGSSVFVGSEDPDELLAAVQDASGREV